MSVKQRTDAEQERPDRRGDEELQGLLTLLDRQDMDFAGAFAAARNYDGVGAEIPGISSGENPCGRDFSGGLPDDLYLASRDDEFAASRENRQRYLRYLDDLRLVLRLPGGAGLRVLRRWLDEASAFSRLSLPAPRIFAAAALADYARDRMAEIALADPAGHMRIQLAGARQWAAVSVQGEQPVTSGEE